MTHRMRLGLLLVCLVMWGGALAQAQDSALLGPLKQQWENIRRNVVGTAEVVPEDMYSFRPTPEVRSLREQLIHIVEENYFFMGMVSGEREQPPGNLQTKAQIIQALNDSYDYGAQVLDGLNDSTAMEAVPLMGNPPGPPLVGGPHEHRGQPESLRKSGRLYADERHRPAVQPAAVEPACPIGLRNFIC